MNSKIIIKNIYYMLSYAFVNISPRENDKIATEDFDNIYNLFAEIISKGVAKQLKQGLFRDYISKSENLNTVRGSINISETMRNAILNKRLIHCDYDELSENNIFNQILKSTIFMLIKTDKVDNKYKKNLKKEIMYFSEIDLINLALVPWNRLSFTKNNKSYRTLVSICQFIAEGLIINTDKGIYKMRNFIDNQRMCRLYEKFILEYYRREHPYIKVNASQIPWALDDGIGTMLPVMQSDITLENKDRILIIDAKYYSKNVQERYEKSSIISGNLYQIFTYVKNKQFNMPDKEVAGMILYARTSDVIQPDNEYLMSGNKISTKTLDLNKDFSDIRAQMDNIAEYLYM